MARPSNWNIWSFSGIFKRIFGERLKDLGLEAIARRGGFNFIGLVITVLSTFVFQFILGKTVSPAEVGIFNLGLTITSLVGLVMLLGLDRGVVRYIAHYVGLGDRQHELGVVVTSLRLVLLIILVVLLLFLPLVEMIAVDVFHTPELQPVLYTLTAALPFLAFTRLSMGILVGYKHIKPMVVIEQILMPVLRILIVLVVILWATPSLVAISSSHLIAAVIGCGLSVFPLRRIYMSRSEDYTPLTVTSELLRFSWPLLFAGLLNRTNTYTETLILGALSSSEQVGFFTVSLKISLVLTIFFEAFNGIWAPYITEAHARGDKEVFAGQFKTVTYWVFAITLPVALWLFIEAPAVMTLFGPEYTSSATVLQILTISQCGYVLGGMSALTLIMTGFSRLNLFDLIVTIILSLVLDFTLIPAYGANGAAVASAIAVIFLTVLRSVQVYVLLRVHPYNTAYIKPILAGAAAYITSIVINQRIDEFFFIWQLLLVGITISFVYCTVMLIFRSGSLIRHRVC